MKIDIHEFVDGNICVALIESPTDGDIYFGVGTSICHPEDEFDENLGIALALSRAHRDLGNRVAAMGRKTEKHLREIVAERDAEREQHEASQRIANFNSEIKKRTFQIEFAKLIDQLHPGTFKKLDVKAQMVADFIASSRA